MITRLFTRMIGVLAFSLATAANSALLDTELVVNGGAENGNTSGWVSTGIDAVLSDGASAGFGNFAFTGGTGSTTQTLSQIIDLNANASDVDAGLLRGVFSIYLQQRSDNVNIDQARVDVSFLDASSAVLDSFFFEDVIEIGVSDWNFFQDSRVLTSGTRSIGVVLTATRTGGVSTDAFFDDVSLEIQSNDIPSPALNWLMAVGLAALLGARKRSSAFD